MKLRQFSIFLAPPRLGWPQGARVQCGDWWRSLLTLSGITYMLLSTGYGGSRRMKARTPHQDNRCSTTSVGPATRLERATIG